MAIPKINSAKILDTQTIQLEFSDPLDTGLLTTPLSAFQLNQGDFPVLSYSYVGNIYVQLTVVENTFSESTEVRLDYKPPGDIFLCLRGSVSNETIALIRSAAVREFSIQVLSLQPGQSHNLSEGYPVAGTAFDATVDDFILAFGRQEAIQLSNIDNPSADTVNRERVKMAITDANAMIESYVTMAPKAGKLLVTSNRRRTSLTIARYYLDSVRRRDNVTQDYERVIKELYASLTNNLATAPDEDLAINNGGILRTWRVPQRYNSVSGKGFAGWWTDSAAKFSKDVQVSEQNNNEDNMGSNYLSRPTDAGGETNVP